MHSAIDLQILGPETGQQAGGEEQGVGELDANGSELHHYFSVPRGAPLSMRSNRVTFCRQFDDDCKVLAGKKVDGICETPAGHRVEPDGT